MDSEQLQELQRLYELYLKEYNSQDAWEAARMHLRGEDPITKLFPKRQIQGCCDDNEQSQ